MKTHKKIIALSLAVALFLAFSPALWAQEVNKVNINKASVEEMTQLQGIGPAYAQRIVQYREQNGPFKDSQDLMKIKGIGPKKWEMIKDSISVD